GTDWLLNFHGGQNLSGSSHLQMLGADALAAGGFEEDLEAQFSEAKAARFIGSEGLRRVKGLRASSIGPGEGGADPDIGYYNADGEELLDTWGTSLKGVWDLGALGDVGSVVLSSLTGTEWYDRSVEDEGDANPASVFPGNYSDSARQISQEFRAVGETDRFGWTAGLFFLHEKVDSFNVFPDTRNFRLEQSFDQTLTAIAPFLGAQIPLSEELGLELGFRYNIEEKDFNIRSTAIGNESGAAVQEVAESTGATWTGPTGDITLTYVPDWALLERAQADEVSMYIKYVRGMKGGHFNASLTVANGVLGGGAEPVNPEFIDSIEGGWKSTWLEERVLFNIALFRYWYQDYQVFDIANEAGALPLPRLMNADARAWGGELDLELRPFPGTFLGTSIGFTDSRFKDFTVTKTIGFPRGQPETATFNYDGNPTISSPRLNLSAVFEQQ
ncbi:MAG: TonB-dependent receptor domain-containing protein, partial [Candidatus Rokuibacteriota bacterium]